MQKNIKLFRLIKKHNKLKEELRKTQVEIIKNHKKDVFYNCGSNCYYTHMIMNFITESESKALDRVYIKYDAFIKSLGYKVYDIWLEMPLCEACDIDSIKAINGFKESDLIEVFTFLKKLGVLVYIGDNEQTGTEQYLEAIYYIELELNKRIDNYLDTLNKKNNKRVKEKSSEEILKQVTPYLSKDLYNLLEIIYIKGSITISDAAKYILEQGQYVYIDEDSIKHDALYYLEMLSDKGFIKKSGDLYISNAKKES